MSAKSRYKNVVTSFGNRLISIADVKHLSASPFSVNHSLFGVIRYVQSDAQGISRSSNKTVTLVDPTDSEGLRVVISRKDGVYHPGDILYIRLLTREQRARSVAHTAVAWDVTEVTAFTTDYDADPDENDTKFMRNENNRTICCLLEEWQAAKLLETSLMKLQVTDQTAFTDLVVQVVRKRLMLQSVVLTVWDGSIPVVSVSDPYIGDLKGEHPTDLWTEQSRDNVKELSSGFAVDVNVWSNEEKSKTVCIHFETCVNQCHMDEEDFLLLLNVEVKKVLGDMCSLTMRSGHHKGKAARIVKSCSVLGRMFQQQMSKSLSQILERELSVIISASSSSPERSLRRRTTIEVVPDRVPISVNRMKELMLKMPPETHLTAVFENSVKCLETLRGNLLQESEQEIILPELAGLSPDEYAELLLLVIQAKNVIE